MNSVILVGRLTRDPELRFLPGNGTAVATFTVAIDKDLAKDKKQEFEQQGKPTADFPNVVVWGRQAENCANYLVKGRLVGIQGRLQTRTYDANDGTKRYITEVVAEKVQFLEWGDSKPGSNNRNTKTENSNDYFNTEGFHPVDDDDIPF